MPDKGEEQESGQDEDEDEDDDDIEWTEDIDEDATEAPAHMLNIHNNVHKSNHFGRREPPPA